MSDLQCSLGEKHHQGTQVVTSQSVLGQMDIDDHKIGDSKPGTLDIMNEMPDDILLEIFSQVEPVDLFHISRATKTLRDLITRNNSMFVWKRVNHCSVLSMSRIGIYWHDFSRYTTTKMGTPENRLRVQKM
jgi:hypothetical protein